MLVANMICLNEAEYVESAIKTLDFCDRIVVVDGGSTDGTWEKLSKLAYRYPIDLWDREWDNNYAAQRQFALDMTPEGAWVLKFDPDEIATTALRRGLKDHLASNVNGTPEAYHVHIWHLVQDRFHHAAYYREAHRRLFLNTPGVHWDQPIHEQIFGHSTVGELPEDMAVVHLSYLDLARLRRKGEHYAKIPGSTFSCWQDLVYRDWGVAQLPDHIKFEADPVWLDEMATRRAER